MPELAPWNKPPGPRFGGLGSAHLVAMSERDPLGFTQYCFDRYGDVFAYEIRGQRVLTLRHPDHIQTLLIRHADKVIKRADLRPFLGRGLLTSDGDHWRRQRRRIQPAFHRRRVLAYGRAFVEETDKAVAAWPDSAEIDLGETMMSLTLTLVCRALFDTQVEGEAERTAAAMRVFQSMTSADSGVSESDAKADLDEMIYAMIERRRREPPGEDLLSVLVKAQDEEGSMSAEQVRDEALTFFIAGHETTAQALTWTYFLLAQHPEALARVHAELDAAFPDGEVEAARLTELDWVRQVASESMRLYPPAYAVPRISLEPFEIDGFEVPAHAQVLPSIFHLHRDPRWFEAPEAFRPERFAPGASHGHPNAYIPFGAGPRTCVGKHFAMLELLAVIAGISRHFEMARVDDTPIRPEPRITLIPQAPIRMRLTRRSA